MGPARFYIPSRAKNQIIRDIDSGNLTPDSPLEVSAVYEFIPKNREHIDRARLELIKEPTVDQVENRETGVSDES